MTHPSTRRQTLRRTPQEKLDRRHEKNRALGKKLASLRMQDQASQAAPPSLGLQIDAYSQQSCRTQAATRLAEWGRCIRYRRVRKGITAQVLCERVGVSLSTLRRLERGDGKVAASTYLIALAELSILGELLQEPSECLLSKPITDGRLVPNHYPRSRIRKWERRTVRL